MGRTRQAKPSVRPSTISDKYSQSLARISLIASAAPLIKHNTILTKHVSTPTSSEKKKMLKTFLQEEKRNLGTVKKMLAEDVDAFVSAIAMLKLSIPPKYLNKPFKQCRMYRDMYSTEPIDEEFAESSYESSNIIKQEGSTSFKAPLMDTLPNPIKRTTRRTSKLCTPRNKPIPTPNVITPKCNMNQPVSVLRYARLGEQAVSMTGSPIMMSSVPREDIAAVSVPFHDGRVLTIMPSDEFQVDQMPSLDIEAKTQLHTLYKNLAVIFSSDD